jgi:hypothetical protein
VMYNSSCVYESRKRAGVAADAGVIHKGTGKDAEESR